MNTTDEGQSSGPSTEAVALALLAAVSLLLLPPLLYCSKRSLIKRRLHGGRVRPDAAVHGCAAATNGEEESFHATAAESYAVRSDKPYIRAIKEATRSAIDAAQRAELRQSARPSPLHAGKVHPAPVAAPPAPETRTASAASSSPASLRGGSIPGPDGVLPPCGCLPSCASYGPSCGGSPMTRRGSNHGSLAPLPRPGSLLQLSEVPSWSLSGAVRGSDTQQATRVASGPRSVAGLAAESASDGRAPWVGHAVHQRTLATAGGSIPRLTSAEPGRASEHALPPLPFAGAQPAGCRACRDEIASSVARRANAEWGAEAGAGAGKGGGGWGEEAPSGAAVDVAYRAAFEGKDESSWEGGGGANSEIKAAQYDDHLPKADEVRAALAYLSPTLSHVSQALEAMANAPDGSEPVEFVADALGSLAQGANGCKASGYDPADSFVVAAAARAMLEALRVAAPSEQLREALLEGFVKALQPGHGSSPTEDLAQSLRSQQHFEQH